MYNFEEKIWCCTTCNANETRQLIKAKFSKILPSFAVYLDGELGTGKTFICKEIARLYEIYNISSSSFSKMKVHNSYIKLIHSDLYNINEDEEFFYNYIYPELNNKCILITEWLRDSYQLDIPVYKIQILSRTGNNRKISFSKLY